MASYSPMKKNTAQRIVFPILDADGDPVTGATGLDSEYSLNGASFGDLADEAHEIATASGIYYLDLAQGETNGDVVAIQVKTSSSGAKTTVLVFYTSTKTLADLNDLTAAAVNAEVDTALNTAIPGTPTSDSVNERVKAIDDKLPAAFATEAKQDTIIAKTNVIGASVALESGGNLATVLTETQLHPTLAEIEATTVLAKVTTVTTAHSTTDGKIDVVDGIVDAIKLITDALTLAAIADAVHDEVTEGTTTLRKAIKLISSALFAKTSGGGTATLIARDIGDTKARITLTVDANGNRTASVLDGA
jgi:hypothetical protein